jgi:hypothetical protein
MHKRRHPLLLKLRTSSLNLRTSSLSWRGRIGLAVRGYRPDTRSRRSDLVLRNATSGAFEVYDIANNQLIGAAALGAVGTDWQVGGIAVDPPELGGSMGAANDTYN